MTDREPFDPSRDHPFSPENEAERTAELQRIQAAVNAAEGVEPNYEIPSPIHASGSGGDGLRRYGWHAERLRGPWMNVVETPGEWLLIFGWRPRWSVNVNVARRS